MTGSALIDASVQRDAEGFFVDPGQWTEEMADAIARENGIDELTERHWIVIRFMRAASHDREGLDHHLQGFA
jgi:tRNA 2-thiouridine synthesizing protein E